LEEYETGCVGNRHCRKPTIKHVYQYFIFRNPITGARANNTNKNMLPLNGEARGMWARAVFVYK